MASCEKDCILGQMTPEQQEAFLIKIADKGGQKALQSIGFETPDDAATFREALQFFKSYKVAKKAARMALWTFFKKAGVKAFDILTRFVAVLVLLFVLKLILPDSVSDNFPEMIAKHIK